MRIVYLTAGSGSMYCGSCLRDGALAAALKRLGHDVVFIPTYTPLKIEAENVAVDQIFYGGVNVYLQQITRFFRHTPRFLDRLLDSKRLLRWVSKLGQSTSARDLARLTLSVLRGEEGNQAKELHRLIEWLATQERPEVVVLSNTLFAGLAAPLRQRLGVPVLCQVAGEDMFVEDFPEPWRTEVRQELCRQTAGVDAILAPNKYYARFMADYLGLPEERVRVVPIGIDLTGFPDDADLKDSGPVRAEAGGAGGRTIGYLARICPQKGLHVLAEAFRILRSRPETADCRLRVAGYLAGEFRGYFEKVESDLRAWGLSDYFEYVGELDSAGKRRFLGELDVFSVPVVYPEPKGQFVPEALAAGTPVVLPRLGCLPEWVEATGGGILVEPGDAAALADGLSALLRDPAQARELGRLGQEAVRARFSSRAMAEETARVLEAFVRGCSVKTR